MLLKATIISDDGLFTADVIAHEGGLWIVPVWNEIPERKALTPARMIRMDTLRFQPSPTKAGWYTVNEPIPKDVLEGRAMPGFQVVLEPDIEVPDPNALH